MNNLQDELAWLNHRLDNKLEEWRKLHRLCGRFNGLLVYSLLVLALVVIGSSSSNSPDKQTSGNTGSGSQSSALEWLLNVLAEVFQSLLSTMPPGWYIIKASFVFILSLLVFGFLQWRLYYRLLTDGHANKASIQKSYMSGRPEESDLISYQNEFNTLLRIERSFPLSEQFKHNASAIIRCLKTCATKTLNCLQRYMHKLKHCRRNKVGKIEQLDKIVEDVEIIIQDLKEIDKKAESLVKNIKNLGEQIKETQLDIPAADNSQNTGDPSSDPKAQKPDQGPPASPG